MIRAYLGGENDLKWFIKRIIRAVISIFLVTAISFFLIRLMPGNPMDMLYMDLIVNRRMKPEQAMEFIRGFYGLAPEGPLYVQFIDYLMNLFRGNLGRSMVYTARTPVLDLIVAMLPWTVFLLSISQTIAFSIGILLGMFLAYGKGGKFDVVTSSVCSVISGIPVYVGGALLLVTLAINLNIFPISGNYGRLVTPGWNLPFIASVLYHAALPILTYVILGFSGWAITMKNMTISVLGEDYVLAAEARGLKGRRVTMAYVGRNAILPLFTSFAISLGYAFGGALFIEQLFAYPGIGFLTWAGLTQHDYPIIQACFLITTISVIVANFVADAAYSILDPRIRLE